MNLVEQIPFFQEMSPEVRGIVLQLLLLLIVLILIQVLRKALNRVLEGPIKRAIERTEFEHDDTIYRAIQRPSRLLVIALSIGIAITILDFGTEIQSFANVLARSLLIASVLFAFYNLVDLIALTSVTLQRITGLSVEERLLPFLRTVLKVLILALGLFIIIQEFGYDATGLVASFGVVGLAFSLAAQDTASNVFGFAAIVSDNPFEVGDYIVTSDFAGVVEHVGVRSTRVRKLDQSLVSVPNNSLTNAAVTNWSRLAKRRLDFMVGLTYDTSAAQMRYILDRLRDMLRAREHIEEDSVVVHFIKFNDSSLDIRIICNIMLPEWNAFTAETELINLEVMEIVEELGLSFAFPSTSIYVETLPDATDDQRQVPVPPRYRRKQRVDVTQEIKASDVPEQDNE
jgi:MscS family membrane protein